MVEFHVLCCSNSNCSTFQVLQVAKTNKWKCKLCNLKQSILKVYGVGTGTECRKHVQKLNFLRGELHLAREEKALVCVQHQTMKTEEKWVTSQSAHKVVGVVNQSRWSKYADAHAENARDENKDDPEDIRPACEDVIKVTTDWTEYKDGIKRKRTHSKTVERTESVVTSSRRTAYKLRKTAAKQSSVIHEQCDVICSAPSNDSKRPSSTPLSLKPVTTVSQCQFGDRLRSSFSLNPSEINGIETITNLCSNSDNVVAFGSQTQARAIDETARQQVATISENNHSLLLSTQQRKNITCTQKSTCNNNETSVPSKWGIFLEKSDSDQRDDNIDQDIDGKLVIHLSSDDAAEVTGNEKVNTNTDTLDELSFSRDFRHSTEKGYELTPAPNSILSTSHRFINTCSTESLETKGFARSPTYKFTFFPHGPSATRHDAPKPLQEGLNGVGTSSFLVDEKKPVFDLQYDLEDVDFDL